MNLQKAGSLLKLFTFVITAIFVLHGVKGTNFFILSMLISGMMFNSFFRQLYLSSKVKDVSYVVTSIIIEIILIAFIGSFSINTVYVLFFFVTTTEANLYLSNKLAVGILLTIIVLGGAIVPLAKGETKDIPGVMNSILSIAVSAAFTFTMGYMVRVQVNEKKRLSKINTELEQAYKKLMDNAVKAQELTIEKERTRMAREIHDTLAHTLTAAVVQMEACKKLIEIDPTRAKTEIEKAQSITREGLNDVKRTIKALRPQKLENSSFFEALSNLICEIQQNTKVEIDLKRNLPESFKLTSSGEVALFRAIQESITNSLRHGAADSITIEMSQKNGDNLTIEIKDNGSGSSYIKKGYGLQGITERIESLNGKVKFESHSGKGFHTYITIPIQGGSVDAN